METPFSHSLKDNPPQLKKNFPGRAGLVLLVAGALFFLEPEIARAGMNGTVAAGVEVSVYNPTNACLVAQVHATRVFVDYNRWGFFRIGLFPMLVVENAQFKIQSVEYLSQALAALRPWNQPTVGIQVLDFRDLEISVCGEKLPRLQAANARLGPSGTMKLSGLTIRDSAGHPASIPNAILQVSGPDGGRLHWNSFGHQQELFIF